MANKLEAHEMPLHKVLSSDHQFVIPEYQRPYSWDDEQAVQLLEDLTEAIERGGDDPYFLGSLVLIKAPDQARADVVDGQQRLTTLTILLAVLRHLAEDDGVKGSIQKLIAEEGDVLQGLEPEPRLTLRPKDAPFFRQWVQEPGGIAGLLSMTQDDPALVNDPRRLIRRNAKAFHERLVEWEPAARRDLASYLAIRTYLVVVKTPTLDSAHRIFSVMNARGLDLEPSDIFKSDVIGKVAEDLRTEYAKRWEDAEELLGRSSFSDLFLHLRMIHAKVRAKRELLREFPDQVLSRYFPDHAAEFVDDVLVPYAKAYADIEDGSYVATAGAGEVNAWLARLRQLDNNDWRPPALWVMRKHGDDPVLLSQFLAKLERLAASMFICRSYTTPRVTRYADLLKQLEDGYLLDAPALELSLEERVDTLRRLNGEIYTVAKTRKYVLERLDEAIAQDPGVSYSHKNVTVEHVLPQNPAGDSPWRTLFTDAERDHWVHRLANLVLLNRVKNPAAGRKPFDEKKETYFKGKTGVATFALTIQVLNTPEWTPQVLAKRQRDLLRVLADAWELGDLPAEAPSPKVDPEPSESTSGAPQLEDLSPETDDAVGWAPRKAFADAVFAEIGDRLVAAGLDPKNPHARGAYIRVGLGDGVGDASKHHLQIRFPRDRTIVALVVNHHPDRESNIAELESLRAQFGPQLPGFLPTPPDAWVGGVGDAVRAYASSANTECGYGDGDVSATADWVVEMCAGWRQALVDAAT
jgi:hypothetical protein